MTQTATGSHAPLITHGTTIGRYRLVERIGAGGMGEVWKAHDDNLDRDVAIKFLLRETGDYDGRNERFRREALALSRLSHPGVATVFDFDVHHDHEYLVMEYVAGGTLESRIAEGPLPIDNVLAIGASLADAIDHAHKNGILHRDLKPGNVVFTADGQPKILDFGLALLLSDANAIARVTQPGTIMGSLGYMAPEQLFGEADARTDTYALGAILFEMTTGQRPFVRDRTEALMFAVINTAPPRVVWHRPDTPDALDRIIGECLRKEPSERPSAAIVAQTLRGIRQGVPATELPLQPRNSVRSIAVLPLRNTSRDPAQEYFADGMTESLISDLARVKALRVISHTSVAKYKGTAATLPEIARELNVDAILEGSALLVGNRVRLSVQLVSARSDETLWADRYDRELKDVLDMQSELAGTVVREIAIQLTPGEEKKLAGHATVNPQAYLEFLKSRHSFSDATPHALDIGLRHARRAVELDPKSALAWTAIADHSIFRAIRGMTAPAEAAQEALNAAKIALELDPTLPDAHVSMGTTLSHSGDVAGGFRHLRRAVELNPGLAHAQNLYGRALYAYERHEEAQEAMHKSMTLDPQSMMIYVGVGDGYYFAREYEKSVVHYRLAIGLDPRFDGAHAGLGRSLEALGHYDEARLECEEAIRVAAGVAAPEFGLAHLEATLGNIDEARRILNELIAARSTRVVSAWNIAVLHSSLGDIDEAFHWLEAAIEEHAPGIIMLRVHPRLDPIRSDPRYPVLLKRLGLDVAP